MNRDQFEGGLRNLRGRGRTALGAVTGRPRQQIDGAVDQVAGTLQHGYGRARETADGLHRDGTQFIDEARSRGRAVASEVQDRAEDLRERGRGYRDEAMRRGRDIAARADDNRNTTLLVVAAAAFATGWLMRRTR
ncbi:CsbD family protein [Methylobacterium sp. Leaf100]|uniref:CsbD family protein n=1 Tax=Methylobacterium sp. Leaf100 TaxID=1736252 RepID=UPI0006FCFC57|nr:CsbD family protein [Methylobacterium sp. Leaf100]KQP34768.1 general stress protein CsbD [Methylobacterium sp. Leaf100]